MNSETFSQSVLNPASPQAAGVSLLWWIMLLGAVIIFVAVMGLLFYGLWQARGARGSRLSWIASRNLVLAAGVAIPLLVLISLVGGSLLLSEAEASGPPDGALTIRVTGWRWWWEIQYLDEEGEVLATTANEMHVPVGRPLALRLVSGDVIHSFWVPELSGKTDLVPGHVNTSWFEVERPGVFRGQCAEFCGTQHALMAFLVFAEPEPEFEAWLARQAQPAEAPEGEQERRGREVFQSSTCLSCHNIRGVSEVGVLGPDLTHFGSRESLAAVTRPNTIGHLGGWIADPQGIKPGNLMPATALDSEELTALIAYLRGLE